MAIDDCRIIELPKINDSRGNLTFLESGRHLPFAFERIFYLYDVPGGSTRAGHALRNCEQFIVAISGSFDVMIDDGTKSARHHLNRSYFGLYVPPLTWREIDDFSSNSVCLVVASKPYSEGDYLREYESFLREVRHPA